MRQRYRRAARRTCRELVFAPVIGYSHSLVGDVPDHADVAQLVEHHLAKVRVAGSSPVVRSECRSLLGSGTTVGWPRGEAAACKAVYTGSNPVPTSQYTPNLGDWRRGSALPSHGRGH